MSMLLQAHVLHLHLLNHFLIWFVEFIIVTKSLYWVFNIKAYLNYLDWLVVPSAVLTSKHHEGY